MPLKLVSVPIRSLRLGTTELRELLDDLDRLAAEPEHQPADGKQRRKRDRVRCRARAVIVQASQQGRTTQFLVPIRNISPGGVGFLHGAMMHRGTPCVVRIIFPNGQAMKATGQIARCRHVVGMIYEVGVKFDREIDLAAVPVE